MVYRFALDIGATRTMIALVESAEPNVVNYGRPSTAVLFTGRRPPGVALADVVRRFCRQWHVELDELTGVGVGVPGVVDRDSGVVLHCPNLPVLDGASLGSDASRELGLPVYVDNNTNLISLGEHTAGVGRGVDDMAVVFVGSGVGSGLILGGHVYEGADGAACELGHTIVVPNGRLCTCGAHGCLEMYCSGKALAGEAERIFKPGELYALDTRFAGAQLLIQQSYAGHERASQALEQAFGFLGVGLTSLVNLLNPRLIVLGGGIVFAWPQGVEIAKRIIMTEALPATRERLQIQISELGNLAGALGGAALVSAGGRVGLRL